MHAHDIRTPDSRPERAVARRTPSLPEVLAGRPERIDEWRGLSFDQQKLVTADAVERWTADLDDDDWTLADVARLERRRRDALLTLRSEAELTDREWQLLRYLRRNEGRTCTYLMIARYLWGTKESPVTAPSLRSRSIRADGRGWYNAPMITGIHVLVHHLRRKLEVDPRRPQHIASFRGVGYRWYSSPPSLEDGESYEARETEVRRLREQMQEAGIFEADVVAVGDDVGLRLDDAPEDTPVPQGREHRDALPAPDQDGRYR